jgi:hypothetical protein
MSDKMWTHWRSKYGYVKAIKDYYPNILEENMELQIAIGMISAAETIIDKIMSEVPDNDDEEDEND